MAVSGEVVVVTGGSGFLGQHIVKHLMEQKEFPIQEVRVFDVHPLYWHTDLAVKENVGVSLKQCLGDLCNVEDLQSAFKGATVVIHNASFVDVTSLPDIEKLYRVNVMGTENVIAACIDNNIKILMYTSSASAVNKFGDYGSSKSQAEQKVLQANQTLLNNANQMRTCVLRLPVMYGEGATNIVGSLGKSIIKSTFIQTGDETSMFQAAYAGNIAWAFVSAITHLSTASPDLAPNAAGCAIDLADDTPLTTFCGSLEPFVKLLKLKSSPFVIPFWILYILASICEFVSFILQPLYTLRIPLSKVSVDHMHNLPLLNPDKARLYFKYKPIYSYEDSVKRTIGYLEHALKIN